MPSDAVYVGRPSKWGNPFSVDNFIDCPGDEAHLRSVQEFRTFLNEDWDSDEEEQWAMEFQSKLVARFDWMREHIRELRGKRLACGCSLSEACHADVLAEYANQ